MNRVIFSTISLVSVIMITGCSVTVGGGAQHTVWQDAPEDQQVLIAEIDAAAALMLESNRENALKKIAMRPSMTADTQVYLLQVSLKKLMLESSRKAIILTLISNPSFVSETKMAILENLDRLMLESSRQEIMDRLNRRGPVPSSNQSKHLQGSASKSDCPVEMETTVELNYSTRIK